MLQIDGLNAFYGDVQVLFGVSLHIREGECVALLGPNGAGKTTLLRALSGLVRRRGRVDYCGQELTGTGYDKVVRAGIIHVPEGREVFSGLTVLDNLMLGAYLYHNQRGEVEMRKAQVFTLFPRLKERQHQYAGTLSGGEQQMLAIGRGLMARPKVLLLDEPSLGLAPVVVQAIMDVVARLPTEGISVLLVEQSANVALTVAQRAYVLNGGKVVDEGPTDYFRDRSRLLEKYLG
ncbi:MAG: ABC transporter ATP-binding protein [Clostridia bacterium]|nr:MAG: ABC transporter ATP-binding protein [Clostridia bacterium]